MRVAATLLTSLVVLLFGFFAPTSIEAHHPLNRLREEYYSSVPVGSRIVFWRACAASDYEENIMAIAFNNWRSSYGNSIDHTKLADSCSFVNDMRVHALSPDATESKCDPMNQGDAISCMIHYNLYAGPNGSYKIPYAEIYYDWQWISDPNTSSGMDIHIFIHEFGHGMGLGDNSYHLSCGTGAMSTAYCTDTVDAGPYPNDVCNADTYGGYPQRCQ